MLRDSYNYIWNQYVADFMGKMWNNKNERSFLECCPFVDNVGILGQVYKWRPFDSTCFDTKM